MVLPIMVEKVMVLVTIEESTRVDTTNVLTSIVENA
jgi:hypothetical protein